MTGRTNRLFLYFAESQQKYVSPYKSKVKKLVNPIKDGPIGGSPQMGDYI